MISTFKIAFFSSYVLRTPLIPLHLYLNTVENYSVQKAKEFYQNSVIKEAIHLASPDLIKELDKWFKNDSNLSVEKAKKLEITFLKYIARMSSRCTPFGLFAGCSVGKIESQTNVVLEHSIKHKRFTQFDMQFWVALLQNIASRKTAIYNLKYFPNSSIYELGDFYRYIAYKYVKTNREHTITAFRKSEVLKEILLKAKSGLTVKEMVSVIADNDSETAAAQQFIIQLIDAQFLISEIDAAITGNNDFNRVLSILKNVSDLKKEYDFLENINKQILDLDKSLIPTANQYQEIKNQIRKEGFEYDEKYFFQTDLNTTTVANTLSKSTVEKVAQSLQFLNGIQSKTSFNDIQNFSTAFTKRYESQEMPIMIVLDTESGLGYPINQGMNDSHEILEAFSFKSKTKQKENQVWTSYDFILEKKLQECIFNNCNKIELSESDFPDFDASLDNVPATFSVMIEVYDNEKIAIESSGNISAAKLFGRFCNGNSGIHELTTEIINKEENHYPDKILAEIVHIPQSRTGNILRRPVLRKHEIAYLANSGVENKNSIELNDLFISVKNAKIILRSKKLDKEIIPCLSNAHNYSNSSNPLYHFLCDLQGQNTKPIHSFNWGVLESHYIFFPRVEHKEVILSKARWIISKLEINSFSNLKNPDLLETFSKWKTTRGIPRFVNWVNADNTLLLDLQTEIGIELFLKSTRNRDKIILEEFLFTEKTIVKNNKQEGYSNQFIIPFYKEEI